jgi:1-acyl-sn-glycerol-3-phosphate acyltransferase
VTAKAARRGFVLMLTLFWCFLRFGGQWLVLALQGRAVRERHRAEWMRSSGRSVLKAMGIRFRVEGELPPAPTMIVANHLSYLDIVICSAAVPCVFVAKEEIASWPIFGVLARLGGTIFLDRESRLSAWDAAETMALRLGEGVRVLFFPEGTSTDGGEILRFHSTLFEPGVEAGIPVTPAAVFYEPDGKAVERDLCWFGDETFLPHLLKVLTVEGFTAVVRFGPPEIFPDRRAAAWRSHDAVENMRRQGTGFRAGPSNGAAFKP